MNFHKKAGNFRPISSLHCSAVYFSPAQSSAVQCSAVQCSAVQCLELWRLYGLGLVTNVNVEKPGLGLRGGSVCKLGSYLPNKHHQHPDETEEEEKIITIPSLDHMEG